MEDQNKILIVEDNPLVQDVLKNLFSSENYEVSTSNNGEEAVELLGEKEVDVIICDIMMPKMDGYMLQDILRQSPEFASIPFIFLSALGENKDLRKGQESGADAYIVKPFDPDELLSIVKGKLKRSKKIKSIAIKQQEHFKTDIIRRITHEFRTPLVAVSTGSEFLLNEKEKLSPDKAKSLIEAVWRGGQRLQALVNDFLLMQQIQSGNALKLFKQKAKDFNLAIFLNEYLNLKEKELVNKGFNVNYVSIDSDMEVFANESHLKEIIEKIISNSIKFTQDFKQIDIELNANLDDIQLTIRDYGQGLNTKTLKRITEIFSQDNRAKQEQQGSGLGLSIAKELAHINNIDFNIANADGQGVVVTLIFARS